jgi:hypothetical protein
MPKYIVRVPELIEHIVEIECVDEQSALMIAHHVVMYDSADYVTESLGINATAMSVVCVGGNE